MKPMKPKSKLGLRVEVERHLMGGDHYFHVVARPVEQNALGKWHHPEDTYEPVNGWAQLSGLQVRCQGDSSSRQEADSRDDKGVYGWEVEYRDVYTLDLREARRHHETLRKLCAGLQRLDAKHGRPLSFGQYVARVAQTIGAKTIVFSKCGPAAGRYSTETVESTVGQAIGAIDGIIYAWAHPPERADNGSAIPAAQEA